MFKTLFNIAHCFGAVLGSSWSVLLDTFEQFDDIMQKRHMGAAASLALQPVDALLTFTQRPETDIPAILTDVSIDVAREEAGTLAQRSPRRAVRGKVLNIFRKPGPGDSGALLTPTRSLASSAAASTPSRVFDSFPSASSHAPTAGSSSLLAGPAPDDELSILGTVLSTLFEGTHNLPDEALVHVVASLSELALMALANAATSDLMDDRLPHTPAHVVDAVADHPVGRRASTASLESLSSIVSAESNDADTTVAQPGGFFGTALSAVSSVAAAAAAAVGAKDWMGPEQPPARKVKTSRKPKAAERPAAASTAASTGKSKPRWSASHRNASKSAEAATDAFAMDSDDAVEDEDGGWVDEDRHATNSSPYEEYAIASVDVPRQLQSLASFVGADKESAAPATPGGSMAMSPMHAGPPKPAPAPVPSPPLPIHHLPGAINTNSASHYSKSYSSAGAAPPPFALIKLIETARSNLRRLRLIWDTVGALLKMLAHNSSALVRQYGISSLAELSAKGIVYTLMGDSSAGQLSQAELLSPFADYWRSPYPDTRVLCLRAVHRVVEESGMYLCDGSEGGWLTLLGVLACAADASVQGRASSSAPSAARPPSPLVLVEQLDQAFTEPQPLAIPTPACFMSPDPYAATADAVSAALVPVGFKCLQLIADDMIADLSATCLAAYIACLSLYSKQTVDVNASLTAVGLLWSVSDVIAIPDDAAPERSSTPMQAHPEASSDGFEELVVSMRSSSESDNCDALWMQLAVQLRALVFGKWGAVGHQGSHPFSRPIAATIETPTLAFLSSSDALVHPDVRNSAMQTLFTAFSTHCNMMSPTVWRAVVEQQLVPLVAATMFCSRSASQDASTVEGEQLGRSRTGDAVRMVVHHSRNTSAKQWNEARVLALQGLSRVIASGFVHYRREPWFHGVWSAALSALEASISGAPTGSLPARKSHRSAAAGSNVPAVRTDAPVSEPSDVGCAAVQALLELALLVCVPAGPAHTSNRSTISVGMKVVNGALVMGDSDAHVLPAAAVKSGRPASRAKRSTPAPISTGMSKDGAAGPSPSPPSVPTVTRTQLWQEVFAVLDTVCGCTAVVGDSEEFVAVALLDCLQNLIDSVAVSAAPSSSPSSTTSTIRPKATSLLSSKRAGALLLVRFEFA